MINNPVQMSIDFLIKRGYKIPVEILELKEQKTDDEMILIYKTIKSMKVDGYANIRGQLWSDVYENVYEYLRSTKPITSFVQKVVMSVSNAYIKASEAAWTDGGQSLPLDDDAIEWAKAELNAQLSYVDSLFASLKLLRKEEDVNRIYEAFQRADGYANALDGFYNHIKTMAYGGKMLTFSGSDGRESCADCKRLKGKRKRASWWVANEYVPPSRKFECGGYHCDHFLIDDQGNIFTI